MGKKPPPSQKYGAPLYAVAWLSSELVFIAGGGGKKSSGIKNRVVALRCKGGELSDELAALELDDCPIRMVALPDRSALLLALGGGGLVQVDVADAEGRSPRLSVRTAGDASRRQRELGVVKCMAVSGDGRHVALGGEDGSVTIVAVPDMHTEASISGSEALPDAVRDVDFSPTHQNRVLASTCEDGSCVLWEWSSRRRLFTLQQPAELSRGGFSKCRFARDGSLDFFTAVNVGGVGWLLRWRQDELGELVLRSRAKVAEAAVTALEISTSGGVLGVGTSEGEAIAVATPGLSTMQRVRNAHMVFVTAAAVAPDGTALLTVSADASARCTAIQKPSRSLIPGGISLAVLIALLAALIYLILSRAGSLPARWQLGPYLRSAKSPYDFPGSPDTQLAA